MEHGSPEQIGTLRVEGGVVAGGALDGRATAITVMTPVRPGHTLMLRAVAFLGAHVAMLAEAIEKLSFIHFARWTIITEIPYNGPPQPREALRYDYLFFESNFNGTWDEYIDAFSDVVPERMEAIWGSSFGFPGAQPAGPFKEYIHGNDLPVAHYYSAYPEATTKEVLAALRVRSAVAGFTSATGEVTDPVAFQAAYEALLTEIQHDI